MSDTTDIKGWGSERTGEPYVDAGDIVGGAIDLEANLGGEHDRVLREPERRQAQRSSGSDSEATTAGQTEKKAGVAAHEDVVVVAVYLYGRGVGRDPVLHVIEIEVRLAQPAAIHHHLVT